MSASFQLSINGLDLVYPRLRRLSQLDLSALLEGIGSEVENQTRRRFQEEKTDADGIAWPEWSERYAASKHGDDGHARHPGARRESGGHSLLVLRGDLQDSLQSEVSGDEVTVGSNMVYALTHQEGDPDRNIPARPFLGLSAQNVGELEDYVVNFMEELVK